MAKAQRIIIKGSDRCGSNYLSRLSPRRLASPSPSSPRSPGLILRFLALPCTALNAPWANCMAWPPIAPEISMSPTPPTRASSASLPMEPWRPSLGVEDRRRRPRALQPRRGSVRESVCRRWPGASAKRLAGRDHRYRRRQRRFYRVRRWRSGAVRFHEPSPGIAVDAAGNLFIGGDKRTRVVSPAGIVNTISRQREARRSYGCRFVGKAVFQRPRP